MAKETLTQSGLQRERRIYNPLSKRLYTLKEAAEFLGRSIWGMRDLIWKGVIPVVKETDGRKMFIDVLDLNSYVERNKTIYR